MDSQQTSGGAIFGKMVAILKEVEAIGKDKKNEQQNFQYRGIDDVYNAINPLLAKYGVFMTSEILSKERQERATKNGGALAFTTLRIRYHFHAEDGSSVPTEVEGEGMDSGDKSSNKAMSVGHKYALLQAFCIPTKDLDDADAQSHEVAPRQSQNRAQAEHPKGEQPKRDQSAAKEEPKPAAGNRATQARAWAEEAERFVRAIKDAASLEAWNSKNAKAIAASKSLAPQAHKNLITAIDKRRADLNPVSA